MPILAPNSLEFISRSPEQTRRVGFHLGSLLKPGDVVCLIGDLGAGKTTLVQGLTSGWGSLDAVTSPTFVLVNVYRRPDGQRLFHLDAYRLSGAPEAEDLDLDTLLENGPLIIEWADRIQETLPEEHLWVNLQWVTVQNTGTVQTTGTVNTTGDEEQRDMVFTAYGPHYHAILIELRRLIYGTDHRFST